MVEVKITIEAPGLCHSIDQLAAIVSSAALAIMKRLPVEGESTNQNAAQNNTPAFVPQVVSCETDAAAQTAQVGQAVQTTQVPVATATPSYTQDDIAKAGAYLADTDKRADLIELLKKFGARSVKDLKPEQYGAFAAELRKLGAKI